MRTKCWSNEHYQIETLNCDQILPHDCDNVMACFHIDNAMYQHRRLFGDRDKQ